MASTKISIPGQPGLEKVLQSLANRLDRLDDGRGQQTVTVGMGLTSPHSDADRIILEASGRASSSGRSCSIWAMTPAENNSLVFTVGTIGGVLARNHASAFPIPNNTWYLVGKVTLSNGTVSGVTLELTDTPSLTQGLINSGVPPTSASILLAVGRGQRGCFAFTGNVNITIGLAFKEVTGSGTIPYRYHWGLGISDAGA